jgi:poly-gamma-glutamate capsule biosynthesis protein CapA/YwtB (metallophosphatase superfamily)
MEMDMRKKHLMAAALAGLAIYAVFVGELMRGEQNKASGGSTKSNTAAEESAMAVPVDSSSSSLSASEGQAAGSGFTGEVLISAAGDCTLGTDANFDPSVSFTAMYNAKGDPSYFLGGVKEVFASDDLTIVNLEGTLTESTTRADKTFAFKGDPSYTQILTQGSVEAVNLANNHSHDYGEQSYTDTIRYVEQAGITSFGYDRSAVYTTASGAKVGLVGTYELADGIGCKDGMLEQIDAVKKQGAELIIASFHWGAEKETTPDSVQRELAHAAIDAGADLVLGHHPHVLQGIETYHGKKIVYSLGNFCFGGNSNPSDKDTMIYQQTFYLDNGAVRDTSEEDIQTIPCRISSVATRNDYRPTILEGEEKTRVQSRIDEYSAGLTTNP